MNIPENFDEKKDFLTQPKIVENYALLNELGVFDYINFLKREIKNFQSLFAGTMDIFAHTTVEEIMDATVRQVSDYSLPSMITFIWKPLQNREDIVIKAYKNYKPVNINLDVAGISIFEPFFRKYPKPINYELFSFEFGQSDILAPFDSISPALIMPIMGPSADYTV